jgi:hypothetical protein
MPGLEAKLPDEAMDSQILQHQLSVDATSKVYVYVMQGFADPCRPLLYSLAFGKDGTINMQ